MLPSIMHQLRNPNVATFFTNRALCYLKLGQWDLSCQDCRRALDMDPLLIKGHFFIGQALIELGHYDDAMKHLQRGMYLSLVSLRLSVERYWSPQPEVLFLSLLST